MRFCSTNEVAEMFGLSNECLRKLRQLQSGPKCFKLGKMVRYRKEDVKEWLQNVIVEIKPKKLI